LPEENESFTLRRAVYDSSAVRGFLRGGNWNNSSNAGVFTMNLNNSPSNTNNNIGLRCALSFGLWGVILLIFG